MGKARKGPDGRIKVTNFRLEDDTLKDLDMIAEHYSAEVGIKVTRAGAIRIAARNERRRVRPDAKTKS